MPEGQPGPLLDDLRGAPAAGCLFSPPARSTSLGSDGPLSHVNAFFVMDCVTRRHSKTMASGQSVVGTCPSTSRALAVVQRSFAAHNGSVKHALVALVAVIE